MPALKEKKRVQKYLAVKTLTGTERILAVVLPAGVEGAGVRFALVC